MKFTNNIKIAGLSLLLAFSHSAYSQPIILSSYDLDGTEQHDGWSTSSLTTAGNPGFPGFPGTGAWPNPIASNSGGDVTLNKVSNGTGGGPYPASGSMYYGGFSGDSNNNGGTLQVSESTPVTDLANIVFQIQIGEAWTYDFLNHELPVLSYNGGNQNLTATNWSLLEQFFNGTVSMPTGEENVYINTYALQWDLSEIVDPITSFSISFTGVQHAQLYALQLDQSDVYTQVVPEPTTYAMLGLGLTALFILRRRSQNNRCTQQRL